MDEKNLIMDAKSGNKQAIASLCEQHKLAVYKIAHRYRKMVPLKDGVQYGFLGLLRGIRDYDVTRPEKFLTYAWYKIHGAIQCSFKHQEKFVHFGLYEELAANDDTESVDNEISLHMLDERERHVLEQLFLYGLGSRVIGKKIGLSHQAVLNIKQAALQKLREYYASSECQVA